MRRVAARGLLWLLGGGAMLSIAAPSSRAQDYRRFRVEREGEQIGHAWYERTATHAVLGFDIGGRRGIEHREIGRCEAGEGPGRPARGELRIERGEGFRRVCSELRYEDTAAGRSSLLHWTVDGGAERVARIGNARYALVDDEHLLPLFPIADAVPRLMGAGRSFDAVWLPDGARQRGDVRYLGVESGRSGWRSVDLHVFVADLGGRSVRLEIDGAGEWMSLRDGATGRRWDRMGCKAVAAGERLEALRGEEESVFAGEDGRELPVVSFSPSGPARAVVVVVGGSGVQDARGDAWPGPRGSWVRQWARGLGAAGLAVLGHDDVGTDRRPGDPAEVGLDDEVADVVHAVTAARARWPDRPVFLMAHSDGGWVAARAVRECSVAGLIEIAVPRRPLAELLPAQIERLTAMAGATSREARRRREELELAFEALATEPEGSAVLHPLEAFGSLRAWRDRAAVDPESLFADLSLPRLRVSGAADRQVLPPDDAASPSSPPVVMLPELDHFLVRNPSGDPERALEPDRRLSPRAIAAVREWIEAQLD